MMEEIVMTVKHQNNLEYIESRDFILVKMAEGGGNERQLLGQYVQKQTKYGTATRLSPKSSTYIKHAVVESDTLMGIALKYGVTVSYFYDQMDFVVHLLIIRIIMCLTFCMLAASGEISKLGSI